MTSILAGGGVVGRDFPSKKDSTNVHARRYAIKLSGFAIHPFLEIMQPKSAKKDKTSGPRPFWSRRDLHEWSLARARANLQKTGCLAGDLSQFAYDSAAVGPQPQPL